MFDASTSHSCPKSHSTGVGVRRALLIGAQAVDLPGVAVDIDLMREALAHHGFGEDDIDVILPATRSQIATSIRRLIAATEPNDTVLLYYSGHGAKLDPPVDCTADTLLGEDSYFRFLVASDFEQSTEGDFRGYTNVELSIDLAELTRITKNVVAIMDCCHAGRMFRREPEAGETLAWQTGTREPVVRQLELSGRWLRSAQQHYAQLQASSLHAMHGRESEANPWAVRLLASSAGGKAYEAPLRADGTGPQRFAGAMTLALHAALMHVDPACTTWQDIGRMLRQTPQRGPGQRVALEGPQRRFLFSLGERSDLGELDVIRENGHTRLVGGRLAGVAVGDRHELISIGKHGRPMSLGEAVVVAVKRSHATLYTPLDAVHLRSVCAARPVRHARARAAIEFVDIEGRGLELLEARVSASGLVRVIGLGETPEGLPLAGRLSLEQAHLQLSCAGLHFDIPRAFDPRRAPSMAERLADHCAESIHRLVRASRLRHLDELNREPNAANDRFDPCWQLDWMRVEGDRPGSALRPGHARLRSGDAFTLTLRPSCTVHLSVLLVRADARIELLTRAQPGGVEVGREGYMLGQRSGAPAGSTRGAIVERPNRSTIATDGPLPAALVVIITDEPVDLRSWEQAGLAPFVIRDSLRGPGSHRNLSIPPPPIRDARYHIEVWPFEVV